MHGIHSIYDWESFFVNFKQIMSGIIEFYDVHETQIDSLSTDYEDSFTLDTFGELIDSFHKSKKMFIIARVQTCDPKQPDKVCIH